MVKFKIKGISTYKSKGKRYYYDRLTRTRIHAPYGTPEFAIEVKEARDAAKNNRPLIRKGTLGALITEYKKSPEFKDLAERTRKDYNGYADDLVKLKDLVLADLTAPDVVAIRNNIAKLRTKDRANRIKTFLSTLFNWGIPNGHIKSNPASKVPSLNKTKDEKENEPNRAWTDEELWNFLENTYPEMRTAIALAAWTSLREQDVIKVPWTAIQKGWLNWTHRKTGVKYHAPISNELSKVLSSSKKSAVTIVIGKRGKPYAGEDGFRSNFNKERNRLADLGLVGRDCTFHGLRHTILTNAAEEGASASQLMSVSGHTSEKGLKPYIEKAQRKKSAEELVSMLDEKDKNRT